MAAQRWCTRRRCLVGLAGLLMLTQIWHKIACYIFVQTCSPISITRMFQLIFNLDQIPT